MLIGVDNVCGYMDLIECKSFRITRNSRQASPSFQYSGKGGTQECKAQFRRWAEFNRGDGKPVEYLLTCFKSENAGKIDEEGNSLSPKNATYYESFTIAPTSDMVGYGYTPAQQHFIGAAQKDVATIEAEIREKVQREYELEDLRLEVAELRKSSSGKWDRIGEILLPVLQQYITGGIQKPVQALAGPDNSETDQEALLRASIQRLYRKDQDIVKHLAKLADIAENKPETFSMMLNMLNNY